MRFPTKNNLLFHSWIQIKEQSGEHSAISASVERPGVPGPGPQPVLWTLVATVYILTSAANRLIGEVVQSRRRPLLGPSPG